MIVPATADAIARAAAQLRAGDVVAFPTETVYGLGADATNDTAVAHIFSIKNRPSFDPLIVHLADPAALSTVVATCPDAARRLVARFWPGPLTVVLPKAERIPDIVTAGMPSVAVRVPAHDVARALIAAADRPIAAPSAIRSAT
jgi:L-threonylcarbamoyladenylate synthase